jgi:O-acetyl-ADP-ribose deacetylase (regulator of RNase III)
MRVISDREAVRLLLQQRERYVLYLGAGASAEAGVKVANQICWDLREHLQRFQPAGTEEPDKVEAWANDRLSWNKPDRRYSACMKAAHPDRAGRVEYFRHLLRGKAPSFCHHATALLMSAGLVRRTALTTNFDKLLENAFVQQGRFECQPIRTEDELQYWQDRPDRFYVLKLHGDYDTGNVLNLEDETITIRKRTQHALKRLLADAGMVVIGTTGSEKSIHTTFDLLTLADAEKEAEKERVLSHGLLWGVYMGESKPEADLEDKELEDRIRRRIDGGEVGEDIVRMMELQGQTRASFSFFPVWGAGQFMLDAITMTGDREIRAVADLYLDHEMRLQQVLARAGRPPDAISNHIASLREQQEKLDLVQPASGAAPKPVHALQRRDRRVKLRVVYGDITSPTLMEGASPGTRGAVVSPEDTLISAGGGVAYGLLRRAGQYAMLNELAKLSPIELTQVAVTSGGNLPVQYIFHAACLRIENDGAYVVSQESVRETMREVLRLAAALDVGVVWVPLMGSGVARLKQRRSLEGILEAVAAIGRRRRAITIVVVIFNEEELTRDAVGRILKRRLADFTAEADTTA